MKPLFHLTMMKMTKKKKRSSRPLSPSVIAMKKKKKRTFVKSSQQQQQSLEREFYLPDECWEHIFTFLINPVHPIEVFTFLNDPILIDNDGINKSYFNSLSLVSKQFLSITNRIIFSTRIYHRQLPFLPSFFRRFSNLNSLDLWCGGSHHLDASIALTLRDRPTLKSLSIAGIDLKDANCVTSYYIDSFVSLKGLNSLKFWYSRISDDLLYSIAREGLPLKKFVLESCTGYSYSGIYGLLSKCHGIQHLGLQGVDFLNNHHVSQLSLFLPDLVSINLNECSKLTELALFAFIKNCHSLGEISMERIHTKIKNVENAYTLKDFDVNPQLKFLRFSDNSFIKHEIIVLFASIFPNLQRLDLSYCYDISGKSICQVLSKCCKVRHLHLAGCEKVRRIKMNFVAPQLELLNLSGTSVDDKTLYDISKSCCGLLQLLIICCKHVTENGVMRVIEKCKQLKEICLGCCNKVNADALISMLSSNPSSEKVKCSGEIRLKF